MKNTKLYTVFLILISAMTFAQNGRFREKIEQIKSLKVAFITNELALTPDESAKFWPLYNAFDDSQRGLKKQKIGSFMDRRDDDALDKMSDKDATVLLTQMESNDDEIYQLRKKFTSSLKGILPAVKILKLKKAEEDFNRKLLKQYREKGGRK